MLRKSLPALSLVLTWVSCIGIGLLTAPPARANEYAAPSDVMTLAASPNGRWIAAFTADGTLLLWDTKTWHRRELISHYTISLGSDGLAFSPDSSRLAVGDGDGAGGSAVVSRGATRALRLVAF